MTEFADYMVFVDESGDHGLTAYAREYPVLVLAFVLIHKETYRNAVVPAIQKLKMDFFGHDQIVLHERDIRRQSPPFGFLRADSAMRGEFLERINAVVRDAAFELFCSTIHKDRLKDRYIEPWNPYEIGLLFGLERLCERLAALGQHGRRIHVIFESRGRLEDAALELAFRRVTSNAATWGWKQTDFSVCQ